MIELAKRSENSSKNSELPNNSEISKKDCIVMVEIDNCSEISKKY